MQDGSWMIYKIYDQKPFCVYNYILWVNFSFFFVVKYP